MELRSVEAIAKALKAENIRYIVVGGLAVNAHGFERFTQGKGSIGHQRAQKT